MTARFALYFAPRAGSAWGRFGARALVGDARRYGFHATLKPPFRLAERRSVDGLAAALAAWCATRTAFVMPPLAIERLGDFVALVPLQPDNRLESLKQACSDHFEAWSAPPDAAEIERRSLRPLAPRFHLSLSGPLRGHESPSFVLPKEVLVFDGVCIFEEPARAAPLREIHRAAFRSGGRLVYVVGPSGAGKDTVLDWVKSKLSADAPVKFARRTITRPAEAGGEQHIAATPETFVATRARGEFAMAWYANGHSYGVGLEIREWLARGMTVVVNGSRGYLPQALRDFPDLEVAHVTAPAEVLRTRLRARGREDEASIGRRLGRSFDLPGAALQVVNDGATEKAGRLLLTHLLAPA